MKKVLFACVLVSILLSVAVCVQASGQPVAGSSSGIFLNNNDPLTWVSDSGHRFNWGLPPSVLQVEGQDFNTTCDSDFQVGNIDYFNSESLTAENINANMNMELTFTLPNGIGPKSFLFDVAITNTPDGYWVRKNFWIWEWKEWVYNPQPDTVVFSVAPGSTLSQSFEDPNTGYLYTVGLHPFSFQADEGKGFCDKPIMASVSCVTPEPGTLLLIGSSMVGMMGLGFRRRRRS